MKRLCIDDGEMLRDILDGEVSPLDLERWFTRVARQIAKKRGLHSQTATLATQSQSRRVRVIFE